MPAATTDPPPLVELEDISKSFGAGPVLQRVSMDLRAGEVHVLAGENGAGKSTLIKILAGVHTDYTGSVRLDGEPRRFAGPPDALRAGIAVIHQELSLVGSLSITDNLFLGREKRGGFGTIAHRRQEDEARRILRTVGLEIDPRRPLASFPISVQQLVEIARASAADARVLIMDEPTSALTEPEAERLFARVRELREQDRAILYISHKLKEIYELADRITVLRDGIRIGTATRADLPRDRLLRWMVGRELRELFPPRTGERGAPLLAVDRLSVDDPRRPGIRLVDEVSLTLHAGEILGLAGLQGSGASRLLHAIFGNAPGRTRGEVTLEGRRQPRRSPRRAIAQGIVLLTNDRKTTGIVPAMDVIGNCTLASLPRFSPGGLLRPDRERSAAHTVARRLELRAPSLDAPVSALSGGNQQKTLLARWLLTEPRVLLLDEPTRGVDVGAKADVYRLLRDLVARGCAILLITSEMEEMLGLADRILVLHRGRIAAEFAAAEASQEAILAAAMGGSAA